MVACPFTALFYIRVNLYAYKRILNRRSIFNKDYSIRLFVNIDDLHNTYIILYYANVNIHKHFFQAFFSIHSCYTEKFTDKFLSTFYPIFYQIQPKCNGLVCFCSMHGQSLHKPS